MAKRRSKRKSGGKRKKGLLGKAKLGKTGKRFKKFAKTRKGKLVIAAGVGVGLWWLLKGGRPAGPEVTLSTALSPEPVKAGELISFKKSRLLSSKRGGMKYDPITTGTFGGFMEFTPSVDGLFTRNVVSDGEGTWAEVKAS